MSLGFKRLILLCYTFHQLGSSNFLLLIFVFSGFPT